MRPVQANVSTSGKKQTNKNMTAIEMVQAEWNAEAFRLAQPAVGGLKALQNLPFCRFACCRV